MSYWEKYKIIIIIMAVLALLGFIDAAYLSFKHYSGGSINCSLLNGCDIVTTSKYSVVLGIPTALLGAIYYLVIFIGIFAYIDLEKEEVLFWTAQLTWIGLFVSILLVSLQVFVIDALCLYCIISATISTALFILARMVLRYKRIDGVNI